MQLLDVRRTDRRYIPLCFVFASYLLEIMRDKALDFSISGDSSVVVYLEMALSRFYRGVVDLFLTVTIGEGVAGGDG